MQPPTTTAARGESDSPLKVCSPLLRAECAASTAATRRSKAMCTRASRRRKALQCCTVRCRRAAHNTCKVVKLRPGGACVRVYAGESCLTARLQAHVRTCWREAESCWVPPSWCCARRQNRGIHGYLASSPRRVRRELSRQRSDLLVAGDEHASRCVRWDRLRVQRGDDIAGRGTQPSEISRS